MGPGRDDRAPNHTGLRSLCACLPLPRPGRSLLLGPARTSLHGLGDSNEQRYLAFTKIPAALDSSPVVQHQYKSRPRFLCRLHVHSYQLLPTAPAPQVTTECAEGNAHLLTVRNLGQPTRPEV